MSRYKNRKTPKYNQRYEEIPTREIHHSRGALRCVSVMKQSPAGMNRRSRLRKRSPDNHVYIATQVVTNANETRTTGLKAAIQHPAHGLDIIAGEKRREQNRDDQRSWTWAAKRLVEFHKPFNCPARRLLRAASGSAMYFCDLSRIASQGKMWSRARQE